MMNIQDHSHLHALYARLDHERARLRETETGPAYTLRSVWIRQIEKEIADERARLGLPAEGALPEMSDDELLRELES